MFPKYLIFSFLTFYQITFAWSLHRDFITDIMSHLLNVKVTSDNSSYHVRLPRSDSYGGCACSKSGFLSSNSLLHLGLGAVLSLGVIFLRMNLPSILMSFAGRDLDDTYHFNWGGLGRRVLEATNDPQTPALTFVIESSLKPRSRVNNSDEDSVHTDCAKQLLCDTAQAAVAYTHSVNKFQLFTRSVILLLAMSRDSFWQLLNPILVGGTGHNCLAHYPACKLKYPSR